MGPYSLFLLSVLLSGLVAFIFTVKSRRDRPMVQRDDVIQSLITVVFSAAFSGMANFESLVPVHKSTAWLLSTTEPGEEPPRCLPR